MRLKFGAILVTFLVTMVAATFNPAFCERSLYVDTAISSEPKGTNKMIRISGKVVDDNRTPVVNAGVSIQVNDPLNSNVHVSFIHTDINGSYVDSFILSGLSPAGNYTVYITASKPGFKDGHIQMVFTVVQPSFELAASPVVISIEPGKPASYNITVSSMSPEEIAVLLSVSGLPNETSYVFSANPIKPSSYATLTIVPSPYTPAGSYNITITGSSSIGSRSINIGLIIRGAESASDSSIYLAVILIIVAVLSGILFYDFRRARRRAHAPEAKKVDKYYLEGLPLDSAALMSMPDHLRKTALVLCHMPEATADEIALKTGRARAVESDYLNQLVTLGHIRKKRKGRKVYFFIESKGN